MKSSDKRKEFKQEFISDIEALSKNWVRTGIEDELTTELIEDGVFFSILNYIDHNYRLCPDEERKLDFSGALHEEWAGRCKRN